MSRSNSATDKQHRYEFVRGDGAQFVAYQRRHEDGHWQTVATWMVPEAACS